MISYEEFLKRCNYSIDVTDEGTHTTSVLAVFSCGFMREFGTEFVNANEAVAKNMVTRDLYDYAKALFASDY